jgi:uncharacterized protein (TIGR01370 family)
MYQDATGPRSHRCCRAAVTRPWLARLSAIVAVAAVFTSTHALAIDPQCAPPVSSWTVYYSDKAPPEAFDPYDLIVLDSQKHPPIRPLLDHGKILLGYLSLGEVGQYRAHYAAVKKDGLLLGSNPNWSDSRYVDLRDPRWVKRVLEELIPAILHKGFHGVFIDTLDDAAHLERLDPVRYRGMTRAAARLVLAIRRHYPCIPIMMNRAYEILPEVADKITYVLGESVYGSYDFAKKAYRLVPKAEYRQQVAWLKAAKRRNPRLTIMTLDYWNPDDRATVARIYELQRKNGFLPQVSVIGLDRVLREPR